MKLAQEQLVQAAYATAIVDGPNEPVLMFEDDLVLGFALCFPDAAALIEGWLAASERVLRAAQFALRRAEAKSWNTYLVLLAEAPADYGQTATLETIEENLVGTRKIVRAGIATAEDARTALLPLLPLQAAPRLEAVDMPAEIRLRTSELPGELVNAFLSEASETVLSQLLDSGQ